MQLFGNRSVHINSSRSLLQEIPNFNKVQANKNNQSPLGYIKKFDALAKDEKENGAQK